ncbi:disease resistance protein SUMM2-like [Cannabis sativa]|uniref:disease resistance protein SUMM2-like n=1 Tax=Cannabis sativa TaxID=3483 RepID=UPI0029CA8CFD|nr:disease resistance protein SUMM2-like [Cannabis sativa]
MAFEGRRRILEDVMNALKDPTVQMIGLCGMGGIGKTTLAKAIARQAKEVNLFDKVMDSAVSQTPDFSKIQCEIANHLGFKFDTVETEPIKADKLRQELSKQVKVLIILDDIWKEINLFEIGIHFSNNQNGCKIINHVKEAQRNSWLASLVQVGRIKFYPAIRVFCSISNRRMVRHGIGV